MAAAGEGSLTSKSGGRERALSLLDGTFSRT